MNGPSVNGPILIEPADLGAAAAALCQRFGDASAEAYRLAALRDVLSSSRNLSQALDEFTRTAATHYRGVHCTADMRPDVLQLTQAMATWADAVQMAGLSYREWQDGSPSAELAGPRDIAPLGSLFMSIYGSPSSDGSLTPPA